MSVYVDNALIPFRSMQMSHMVADTTAELLAMCRAIGVNTKWIQKAGSPDEHFDICKAKRDLAIRAGAKTITTRDVAEIMRSRRIAAPVAAAEGEGEQGEG